MASRRLSSPPVVDPEHRYRLVVIATGMGEVVEAAGGFLCDQARAGWDVSVAMLPGIATGSVEPCDPRPLSILGIAAREPVTDWTSAIRHLPPGAALAVDADLLARDAAVRDEIAEVAARGLTELTVWGRPPAAEIGRALEPMAHALSAAALAFKSRALLAAGVDAGALAPTETLYRPRSQTFRRLYPV
jgi:hypothetical protein